MPFALPSLKTALAIAAALFVAGLLAAIGYLQIQNHKLEAQFSAYRADVAEKESERDRLALENSADVGRLQARHAAKQQESVYAYQKRISRLEHDRRDLPGLNDGLRISAETYAARFGANAAGDSDACRNAKTELRSLARLLAEGAGLVRESEILVSQRDAELTFYIEAQANDRQLCTRSP